MANRRYTLPELMSLADRLIARGASVMFESSPEVKKDVLTAGRILARLLLNGTIKEAVELEDGSEGK